MTQDPTNLLIPFRRDKKRDLAFGSGVELLRSQLRQVLLTRGATPRTSGELPWRTSFGAGLDQLRHQQADDVWVELARVQIRDAIQRWLPEVELREVQINQQGNLLEIQICVSAVSTNALSSSESEVSIRIEL